MLLAVSASEEKKILPDKMHGLPILLVLPSETTGLRAISGPVLGAKAREYGAFLVTIPGALGKIPHILWFNPYATKPHFLHFPSTLR